MLIATERKVLGLEVGDYTVCGMFSHTGAANARLSVKPLAHWAVKTIRV